MVLRCAECQTLLRDHAAAQAHAEETGHQSFEETDETLLNLRCVDCGKVVNTQPAKDGHTRASGHAEYVDNATAPEPAAAAAAAAAAAVPTAAAAAAGGDGDGDAALLQAALASGGGGGAAAAAGGGGAAAAEEEEETVSLESLADKVSPITLDALTSMGFPRERSIKAALISGNASVEMAISWLEEHAEDADVDAPLAKSVADKLTKPKLSAEERTQKAAELQARLRLKRSQKDAAVAEESEKLALESSKQLQLARRKMQENEMKEALEYKQREKKRQAEERARLKEELRKDKAERFGESAVAEMQQWKPGLPQTAKMRAALRQIRDSHKEQLPVALKTLGAYIGNLQQNPADERFRNINLANAKFQQRVGSLAGGCEFLKVCGFVEQGGKLVLGEPGELDPPVADVMKAAAHEIDMSQRSPFYLS